MKLRQAREQVQRMVKAGVATCDFYNAGGNGGQHGNRTMSACRISGRYTINGEPVAIQACANMKSQGRSLATALLVYKAKLKDAIAQIAKAERGMTAGFGSSNRVRTYHEHDNRVKDTSGAPTRTWSSTIGKGSIGSLIEARRLAMAGRD